MNYEQVTDVVKTGVCDDPNGTGDQIEYVLIKTKPATKSDIADAGRSFSSETVDLYENLSEDEKSALISDIEKRVTDSHYAEQTAIYMARATIATDLNVTAKTDLAVTGEALPLVNVTGKGGTVKYRVNNDPEAPSEFTSELPNTTEAGVYTVEWYVEGDNNYRCLTKTSTTGIITEITEETPNVVTVKVKDVAISAEPEDYTGEYDGESHSATVTAIGPKSIKIVYSLNENEKIRFGENDETMTEVVPSFTDAGEYTVYYRITSESEGVDPVSGSLSVVIGKKQVTVTPVTGQCKFIGEEDPKFSYTINDLIGEDELEIPLGRKEGEDIGTYDFVMGELSEDVINYDVVFDDQMKFEIKAVPVGDMTAELDKTTFENVGDTAQIAVTISPENATNKDVTFESSAEDIATVDENGKVTVHKNGDVVFTVTANDGKSFELMLSVSIDEINKREAAEKAAAEKAAAEKAAAEREAAEKAAAEKAAAELEAAKEEAQATMNEQVTVTQEGSKISVGWKKSMSADGYYVYAQYYGKKVTKPVKIIKNHTTTKTTITRINGKKISQKKNFFVYVVPYKIIDGKNVELGKSTVAYLVGSQNTKYSNVRSFTLIKSKYSVKVGKTAKIKAKITLVDKNKKHLPKEYGAKFRYKSSDTGIATVSKSGKIKGIGKGTCTIYVYSVSGLVRKAKVTVE